MFYNCYKNVNEFIYSEVVSTVGATLLPSCGVLLLRRKRSLYNKSNVLLLHDSERAVHILNLLILKLHTVP